MITNAVKTTMDIYEDRTLRIEDPEVIKTAAKVAYWYAMYDAALNDPMDDDAEQEEILGIILMKLQENNETYQTLVNEYF